VDRTDQSGQTSTVEQEVLNNILHQQIGEETVDSLNLPRPFLRRVADRIIRASYQQQYHVVVADVDEALSAVPPSQDNTKATTDKGKRIPPAGTDRNASGATTHRSWPYWVGLGLLVVAAGAVVALGRGRGAPR